MDYVVVKLKWFENFYIFILLFILKLFYKLYYENFICNNVILDNFKVK